MSIKLILFILVLCLLFVNCEKCEVPKHNIIGIDIMAFDCSPNVHRNPIGWHNIDGIFDRLKSIYNSDTLQPSPDLNIVNIRDSVEINRFLCKFNKIEYKDTINADLDINIFCILYTEDYKREKIIALNDVNRIKVSKTEAYLTDSDFGKYVISLLKWDPWEEHDYPWM